MGGKKHVWRIAAAGALVGGALMAPAYAAGQDLVGNTVGGTVQQVAESLPPVELLPAPEPAVPAPRLPAPAAPAPAAPSPAPSAPAPAAPAPSTTRDSSAAASGSTAARSAGGYEAARGASSASGRRAASASAGGADSGSARGQAGSDAGRVQAGAASSDDAALATVAQASETADPVVTGAQQSVDSGGSLPFTGADLALLVALGLASIGTGLALRRVAAA